MSRRSRRRGRFREEIDLLLYDSIAQNQLLNQYGQLILTPEETPDREEKVLEERGEE